ncbi:hypothetical protein H4696_009782 [Amycolatopsis lexingtonensis]|uniref:Uncharacterized protein n=1 Tax=Amycolatopsis lexingtonensis TaxID=218822 RepID=A0ABR9IHL2_9PSEU|nr:hypothetical protein [Amycolatopsis lexingtonensis]MBE1502682.1 hypothetical protein [Amycolatopsis lexingtonensis]
MSAVAGALAFDGGDVVRFGDGDVGAAAASATQRADFQASAAVARTPSLEKVAPATSQ